MQDELMIEQRGSLLLVRLNRPKVLNSLSLNMVRLLEAVLDDVERDATIRAVLMIGEGDRAFCAGGDIRALYDAGRAGEDLPEIFWREEYCLDERLSRYGKPVLAVMNGITMGGGVGLAGHASHRIVIERTRFAMPEVGIGFFPDVGASWLLTRKPGHFGTYVALTGVNCGPAETMHAGIGDYFIPEAAIEDLVEALGALPRDAGHADVTALVEGLAQNAPLAVPPEQLALIDRAFSQERVEDILSALSAESDPLAAETGALLAAKSPLSLKITLALYRMGRTAPSLRACLEQEFRVTGGMTAGHDFYEGVRAAIIDKDRNPRWQPATVAEVSPALVESYFIARHRPLFA